MSTHNEQVLVRARRALWKRGSRGDPIHPIHQEGLLGPRRLFSRAAEEVLTYEFGPDWDHLIDDAYEAGTRGDDLDGHRHADARRYRARAKRDREERHKAAKRHMETRQALGTWAPPKHEPERMRPELREPMPWDLSDED